LSADRGSILGVAAEQWLADVRAGYVTNRSGDPFKPSAIRAYEKNLRLRVLPVLGYLRLREIKPRDVQALVDGLVRDGLAPATIDATLTPLRSLYRRAVVRGEATSNPTRGVEKPAVRCSRGASCRPTKRRR
jgi:site-specific recombinase XerC